MIVIGREYETAILHEKLDSGASEFVALYGRRRIGKTYLVRNLFEGKFTLWLTGIANVSLQEQLDNFNTTLKEQQPVIRSKKAKNWMEAFQLLKLVIGKSKQKKKVIFIDELPWFDSAHSGFIPALEHFWNSWASARKDILLIVCGSAASWMINRLINNKGGLHNRVTQKIKMEPFTLNECMELLRYKKITMDPYQLIQLYMVLGGIPYYWSAIQKGLSAPQNINRLCFEPGGLLKAEFNNLFQSLFNKAERHEAIVMTLAQKSKGLTRAEIAAGSKISNGGGLTRLLEELEESGFIRRYTPYGKLMRNSLYQLSDFFTLFHLRFIKGEQLFDKKHWIQLVDHPKLRAWSGYAFEQVCLAHVPQIKAALGISGIAVKVSSWRSHTEKDGAQIDLIIDRRDGVINVCEMKFSFDPFIIDKKYDAQLRQKIGAFRRETGTRKALFLVMISTYGLRNNAYSGHVQNDLKMDILLRKEESVY